VRLDEKVEPWPISQASGTVLSGLDFGQVPSRHHISCYQLHNFKGVISGIYNLGRRVVLAGLQGESEWTASLDLQDHRNETAAGAHARQP
jgi:hypothetical protein